MNFLALYRKGFHHGSPEDRSSNSHYCTFHTSACLLFFPATLHSQAYLILRVLAAKFVVRVHLFLVLVLEVQKTLQFLLIEDCFDDVDGDVLRTVVLWTLDDEVSAVLIFPHVAFHTIQAESMSADLLAVTIADVVADIAENFRQSLFHLHLVLPFQRNWGQLVFCALGVRSPRPRHISLYLSEHAGDDVDSHLGSSQIHMFPIDILHIFLKVLYLLLDQRLHLFLFIPVGLKLDQYHQFEQFSLVVEIVKTKVASIEIL